MKKEATVLFATCLMFSLAACSSGGNGVQPSQSQKAAQIQETTQTQEATQTQETTQSQEPTLQEYNETQGKDEPEADFSYDYSEDIRADIDFVVSISDSLQKELENVDTVIQKYEPLAKAAQSQAEMNLSSKWFFVIWDTELNNLWSRFSNLADQQTKETVLADQRNWIDMKEEAILENVGSIEENGSMYPLLVNSFLEEITENRAYILANELAKVKDESFIMPEKSEKYGFFVDNQGTGSIYSSLITRRGESGDDEAVISIHRLAGFKGTFVDNGNGELSFTSNDADTRIVKGIIKINGWNGATFTVTEAPEEYIISVGEEFDFPFAF